MVTYSLSPRGLKENYPLSPVRARSCLRHVKGDGEGGVSGPCAHPASRASPSSVPTTLSPIPCPRRRSEATQGGAGLSPCSSAPLGAPTEVREAGALLSVGPPGLSLNVASWHTHPHTTSVTDSPKLTRGSVAPRPSGSHPSPHTHGCFHLWFYPSTPASCRI